MLSVYIKLNKTSQITMLWCSYVLDIIIASCGAWALLCLLML